MKIKIARYSSPRFTVYRTQAGYCIHTNPKHTNEPPLMAAVKGPIVFGTMTRENAAKALRELRKEQA